MVVAKPASANEKSMKMDDFCNLLFLHNSSDEGQIRIKVSINLDNKRFVQKKHQIWSNWPYPSVTNKQRGLCEDQVEYLSWREASGK